MVNEQEDITIKFNVEDDEPTEELQEEAPPPVQTSLSLKIRKSVDGNIMIYDHPDMDIVIMPSQTKVVCFPKNFLNDGVYDAQRSLMHFLRSKGVIVSDSVQGGNIYGALEATYPESSDYADPAQVLILVISKFLEKELPNVKYVNQIKQRELDDMTRPNADKTTELGEIPQGVKKGALRTNYAPYGATFRTFEE